MKEQTRSPKQLAAAVHMNTILPYYGVRVESVLPYHHGEQMCILRPYYHTILYTRRPYYHTMLRCAYMRTIVPYAIPIYAYLKSKLP